MLNQRLLKFVWRGISFCCVLGFLTVFMPVAPLEPLVQRDEWVLKGGVFENAKPEAGNVEPSILNNWRSRYFRSWSPEGGSSSDAEIRTAAFSPPHIMVVPFVGYPAESNIQLDLVCETNNKKQAIATGNAHEIWSQRVVVIKPDWCDGKVAVVASSQSSLSYIGLGTPYKGDFSLLLKHSVFSLLFLHAVVFALLVLPLFALEPCMRKMRLPLPYVGAIACFGLIAYAEFFLIQWDRAVAACVGLALYAGGIYAAFGSIRRGATPVASSLKLIYLFSLSMFLLLEMVDPGVGAWSAAYRFLPAVWSSDHLLPRIVAEGIYDLKPLAEILGGSWHVSDRPPLMTGLQLIAQPILEIFRAAPASSTLYHYMPKLLGIISASGIVVPVAVLVFKLGNQSSSDAAWRVWAAMLVLFSPFVIFNTIYTWPKLITAFLSLLGIFMLGMESASTLTAGVVAGVLFALSLLAHAGSAFGLLALPLFVRALSGRWMLTRAAISGVIAVLCWVPWALWQHLVDPPGNALTKFALTGSFGFSEQAKPLGVAVAEAYRDLTFSNWWAMKLVAIKNLFGLSYVDTELNHFPTTWIGSLRLNDFLFVFPALRFLGVALVVAIFLMFSRRFRTRMQAAYYLLAGAALSLALNIVVTWNSHINHHQSYVTLIMLLVACALFCLTLPKWLRLGLMSCQTLYVFWVWGVDPIFLHRTLSLPALSMLILVLILLVSEAHKLATLEESKASIANRDDDSIGKSSEGSANLC